MCYGGVSDTSGRWRRRCRSEMPGVIRRMEEHVLAAARSIAHAILKRGSRKPRPRHNPNWARSTHKINFAIAPPIPFVSRLEWVLAYGILALRQTFFGGVACRRVSLIVRRCEHGVTVLDCLLISGGVLQWISDCWLRIARWHGKAL